jgi:uncharacterized coiled-coil DUF342 family protein
VDIGVVAQWTGTGVIALGLGYTWYRNGKSGARETGNMITEVKGIKSSVQTLSEKMDKMDEKLDSFQNETTKICTSLTEKVNENKEEIDRLRDKKWG